VGEHVVEVEDIVARHAEHVADAVVAEPADQVLPDRQLGDAAMAFAGRGPRRRRRSRRRRFGGTGPMAIGLNGDVDGFGHGGDSPKGGELVGHY